MRKADQKKEESKHIKTDDKLDFSREKSLTSESNPMIFTLI